MAALRLAHEPHRIATNRRLASPPSERDSDEPAPRSQDEIPTVPPPRSGSRSQHSALPAEYALSEFEQAEEHALEQLSRARHDDAQRISGIYAALREEVWLHDGDPRRD